MVGGVCDCSVAMRILPAVCNYRNDLYTYLCECPLQFLSYVVCVRAYTVNSLFFIVEIFSDAHSENLLLGYYSTAKICLQRNIISFVYLELKYAHVSDYSQNVSSPLFQAVATRSQRIALRSTTFCRYCLGSLEHTKSSPTAAAHISLYT